MAHICHIQVKRVFFTSRRKAKVGIPLSLAVQCQKITRSFQIRNPVAKKTLHVAFAPCLWMHGNASHISCAEQLTPCCHLLRKHRNLGPESAVFRNSDAVDPCHFRSCLINPWD